MKLPLFTSEKAQYCDYWATNATHFDGQGCYTWMAEQLKPLQPKRILDIGCGTGQGLLALLSTFRPTIVSLEENGACINQSIDTVGSAGFDVGAVFRLGYEEFSDGTHSIVFDQRPIVTPHQVTLVHADALVDDPELSRFLNESEPFDVVTVWLIGTYNMRRTCRNIFNLKITDHAEYRLHVQNRIYMLADRVLRPGGWLHVVDRGEPPATNMLKNDLLNSHRDQARPTTLEVFRLDFREYTEPTNRGISMVASLGTSGRMPELNTLAMQSILSRKPET